jgi:hypothetical protein
MQRYADMIRMYLGPWGFQGGRLDHDGLIEIGKLAFDVPGRSLDDVAMAIKRLGTRERSARVREAVRRHWPAPTVLLPADAPVRRMLKRG